MARPAHTDRLTGLTLLTILLAFTLASAVAINPYAYGSGDNAIAIPFVNASVQGDLYPGDYAIAQRPFYYTYLWNSLGLLHARLGIPLPGLFFAVYLTVLFLTFLAVYLLAVALFDRTEIAVLALLFLSFAKETLGGVQTIEEVLNTRAAATPLLLLAIHSFLRGSTLRSFLWLGVANLIHPLTTNYVLAMLGIAALVASWREGPRRLVAGIAAFLLVSSPMLWWSMRHRPPSLHLFSADPEWVLALHERSSHHMFPLTWGPSALVHVAVTLTILGIAWRSRNAAGEDRHAVIRIACWTILAWCVIGFLGSELHPMGIVFVLQPFRSFQFMEYFVMLYSAHFVYRHVAEERRVVPWGAAIAAGIGLGATRPGPALLTMAAIIVFMVVRRRVWPRDPGGRGFVAAVVFAVCLAGGACYTMDRIEGTTFNIANDATSPLFDVGRWARGHTDIHDGFIVPPYGPEEFRIYAMRAIFADVEDGGLMNANPEFGKEWLRRMDLLGFSKPPGGRLDHTISVPWAEQTFCRIEPAQLQKIVREMHVTNRRLFLVWPCRGREWPFPQRYRNDTYVVYEVG